MSKTTKRDEILPYDYGQDANAGWEGTSGADFAVPFLKILPGSGEFANSVTGDTYGKEIIIIPCTTRHTVVEWIDRDVAVGGFVAVHELDSDLVQRAKAANGNTMIKMKAENGNDLVETYTIFALRLDDIDDEVAAEILVIPFTVTKIKRYQAIMTKLRSFKGSLTAPLFSHRVRAVTTPEKNKAGKEYFNMELTPAVDGDIRASQLNPKESAKLLEQGRRLRDDVKSGAARAGFDTAANDVEETQDEVF